MGGAGNQAYLSVLQYIPFLHRDRTIWDRLTGSEISYPSILSECSFYLRREICTRGGRNKNETVAELLYLELLYSTLDG